MKYYLLYCSNVYNPSVVEPEVLLNDTYQCNGTEPDLSLCSNGENDACLYSAAAVVHCSE